MALFTIADGCYLRVTDLARAADRFKEKFDLKPFKVPQADSEERGQITMAYDEVGGAIDLGRNEPGTGDSRPMLYTGKINKAHEVLAARGVHVGPVQRDAQGTAFFEARDLDGNVLEICEEP
jgi:predicted enzyme related to lactoylglutathione lyase